MEKLFKIFIASMAACLIFTMAYATVDVGNGNGNSQIRGCNGDENGGFTLAQYECHDDGMTVDIACKGQCNECNIFVDCSSGH